MLAPGVPLTHPEPHWTVAKARAAGVEIIGDVELFCRERAKSRPDAPFVAITGTNGKSTTTALIAHILRSAGRDVQMGGNIGTAILDLEPPSPTDPRDRDVVVPDRADAVAGAQHRRAAQRSPDHLDRHGTMEHYAALEGALVERARASSSARTTTGAATSPSACGWPTAARVESVSARERVPHGWYAVGTELVARAPWTGPLGAFADLAGIGFAARPAQYPERARRQCCALMLGVAPGEVAAALRTFPACRTAWRRSAGRPHAVHQRQQGHQRRQCRHRARRLLERDIFWILGGKPKQGGITSLEPLFSARRQEPI